MLNPLQRMIPGYIRILKAKAPGKLPPHRTDALMQRSALFLGMLGFSMSYYSTWQMHVQQKSAWSAEVGYWWSQCCLFRVEQWSWHGDGCHQFAYLTMCNGSILKMQIHYGSNNLSSQKELVSPVQSACILRNSAVCNYLPEMRI